MYKRISLRKYNIFSSLQSNRLALAYETGMESLNLLSKTLIDKGATVNLFEFTLGLEENIKDVVEGTIGQFDHLDALILTLEEPYYGDINVKEPAESLIESILNANYYTQVYFAYYALPYLRKSNGKIILLTSFNENGQDIKDALFYASRGATLGLYSVIFSSSFLNFFI